MQDPQKLCPSYAEPERSQRQREQYNDEVIIMESWDDWKKKKDPKRKEWKKDFFRNDNEDDNENRNKNTNIIDIEIDVDLKKRHDHGKKKSD